MGDMAASARTYRLSMRNRIKQGKIVLCAYCGESIPAKSKDHPKGGMSTDHIVPRALGGKNHISNYQPMHILCNQEKGANPESKPNTSREKL